MMILFRNGVIVLMCFYLILNTTCHTNKTDLSFLEETIVETLVDLNLSERVSKMDINEFDKLED